MRMSQLFFQTLREAPADAEIISHQLMVRASLIYPVAAGIFDFLPLGLRIKHKIEQIMREEMDAIGGQEVTLPTVLPAELWQRSGRWYQIGDDMARLKDRNGRDYCLGMTHEEVMADLAKAVVNSYRKLPFVLYQIQTKFRDEPRPRAGAIRVREFTMKDAYSFDRDFAGLDAVYPKFYQAYFNTFRRCGLEVVAVESDTGMMGGTMAHEFMALTPVGEDTLLICDACGYSANRQIATFRKPEPVAAPPAAPALPVPAPPAAPANGALAVLAPPPAPPPPHAPLLAAVGASVALPWLPLPPVIVPNPPLAAAPGMDAPAWPPAPPKAVTNTVRLTHSMAPRRNWMPWSLNLNAWPNPANWRRIQWP